MLRLSAEMPDTAMPSQPAGAVISGPIREESCMVS
jgi:hypothetical protein